MTGGTTSMHLTNYAKDTIQYVCQDTTAGEAPREARTRSTEDSRGNRGTKGREVS